MLIEDTFFILFWTSMKLRLSAKVAFPRQYQQVYTIDNGKAHFRVCLISNVKFEIRMIDKCWSSSSFCISNRDWHHFHFIHFILTLVPVFRLGTVSKYIIKTKTIMKCESKIPFLYCFGLNLFCYIHNKL